MKNRTINIAVVAEVAMALEHVKHHMVFVGGAVVSLYADDSAADEIRPTQDIDMTLNPSYVIGGAKSSELPARRQAGLH